MSRSGSPLLREVNLTTARNLSPLFDEAVHGERPVMIVRGGRERGLLLSREAMLRLLDPYRFHVTVLPEDDGGYTLWLRELNVAGSGPALQAARQDLLAAIRSYVLDYFEQFDFYRHLPELAAQEPYVVRLSLVRDEAELLDMLFGDAREAAPSAPGAAASD
jgi:hypothetical protein